jgi:hypothetical protein
MTTYQILVDILQRITDAYSLEVENLAESVSIGGTGGYEDMSQEDIDEVRPGRLLVAEARNAIACLNQN